MGRSATLSIASLLFHISDEEATATGPSFTDIPSDLIVTEDETLQLTFTVDGFPKPRVSFYLREKSLEQQPRYLIGNNTTILLFYNTQSGAENKVVFFTMTKLSTAVFIFI